MPPPTGILPLFSALRLINAWLDGHRRSPDNLVCVCDAGKGGKVPRARGRRTNGGGVGARASWKVDVQKSERAVRPTFQLASGQTYCGAKVVRCDDGVACDGCHSFGTAPEPVNHGSSRSRLQLWRVNVRERFLDHLQHLVGAKDAATNPSSGFAQGAHCPQPGAQSRAQPPSLPLLWRPVPRCVISEGAEVSSLL
jgi:hypothetical protein